ncbi:MAG: hypothetical protein ACYDEJ_08210 [Desulfitobacteriaceae bacterium]
MSDSISSCEDWEQVLQQIKAVAAVRINENSQGEIEEIHIMAYPGRNPKQIVRDVESILAAQFRILVDHKKISVAQVEYDQEGTLSMMESIRPKLVGVTLRTANGMAEVKVELRIGEKLIEGTAQGPSSSYNNLRLFVEATIRALNLLTLENNIFVTEDVVITQLAKHQIALVSITLITSTGEQSLTGCAFVRNDDREAVVKATLDAVNRRIRFLFTKFGRLASQLDTK